MIIATAGHVDHGKSLLVRCLTGTDPDRWEEEKSRGLTIDLGFAYKKVNGISLGFIDVPGHIRFINNMLAGVSTIDFALLVVAADDGPMPQTSEHLAILSLLEIEKLAVVISKIDRCSPESVAAASTKVQSLLKDTAYSQAPLFKVSGTTGEGIDALEEFLIATAAQHKTSEVKGRFRLAVDRCFNIKGAGLVVTGSVFSGSVKVGDELKLLPHNLDVKVRGIYRQNEKSESGTRGDRCAINLTGPGLKKESIHRGNWIADTAKYDSTDRADARFRLLASESKPFKHWTPVHIHSGANHQTGYLATLESKQIVPGETGLVQIKLNQPINLWHGDRVIIRDQSGSRTLGGGNIIDPCSPKRGRAKQHRLTQLQLLEVLDISAYLETFPHGLNLSRLSQVLNVTASESSNMLNHEQLVTVNTTQGNLSYSSNNWSSLSDQVVSAMDYWHKTKPQTRGPNPGQLMSVSKLHVPNEVLSALVDELVEKHTIFRSGNSLHLKAFVTQLSSDEMTLWKYVEPIFKEASTRPPVTPELAKQLGLSPQSLDKKLARFIELKMLVRPVKNRYFLPESLEVLKNQLIQLGEKSVDNLFSAADFRDVTGIGRNLAIEILEFFDHQGITQRIGDRRRVTAAFTDSTTHRTTNRKQA